MLRSNTMRQGKNNGLRCYNGPGTGSNGASAVGLDSVGDVYVTGSPALAWMALMIMPRSS